MSTLKEDLNKSMVGDHIVLLYEEETSIIEEVSSFIVSRLNSGEKCMYISGGNDIDALICFLKKIIDLDNYMERGQLFFLSNEDAYAKDGEFDPDKMIEFVKNESIIAVNEGFTGLAVTGEISWVLNYSDGKDRIIEYEWKLNDRIFNSYPVVALCRYNISKFSVQMIRSIIEVHPFIIWKNNIHENPYYINPDGFKNNKIDEYEVKSWLQNMNQFTKITGKFKKDLKDRDEKILSINKKLKNKNIELDNLAKILESVIETTSKINNIEGSDKFLDELLQNTVNLIEEADYGKILIFEEEEVVFKAAVGHDLEKLNKSEIKKEYLMKSKKKYFKNYSVLDKEKTPKTIYDNFMNSIKPIKESLITYLKINNENVGIISIEIAKKSNKIFSNNSERILNSIERLASSNLAIKRYNELQINYTENTILSFTKMLENHDKYTSGHNKSVADLSKKMAELLGLNRKEIGDIYWSGLVHDIGKILVPEEILNKPGRLIKKEYEHIKKHTLWGYEALSVSKEFSNIANYVLHHHERWDGKGYPTGKEKEDIPLGARILSLVDTWDTMLSDRSYRMALSEEKAIKELLDNKGSQFDPELVDIFINKVIKKD